MVEVVGEPSLQAAADEPVADSVPLDAGAHQHHATREKGREADTHLVEDNTGKDEEHVEERLGTLHGAEGVRIPAALRLHEVFDRRQDVYEDVGTEHGQCQEQQGGPTDGCRVAQSFIFHFLLFC